MYDSRSVANAILSIAEQRHRTLTPMQLLKLVYIAHGWALALLGRPLIKDHVEAWQYGPVIPTLYSAVREYKSDPVVFPIEVPARERIDPEDQELIEQIVDIYGNLSGPALSRLTHKPGSPWARTFREGSFGLAISNDVIEDHYSRMAAMEHAAE